MASHICPWWGGYFIDNRLRRWIHNPEKILVPYVTPGMTALDFTRMLSLGHEIGFVERERPKVRWSRAVLFELWQGDGSSKDPQA
jgi:hypothetical protein